MIARFDRGGVNLTNTPFGEWLQIRKIGWQVDRLQRKRRRLMTASGAAAAELAGASMSLLESMPAYVTNPALHDIIKFSEQLKSGVAAATTHQYSLDWVLDPAANPNDDVVYYFTGFLTIYDLLKVSSLSSSSRERFASRSGLWRMRCASHPRWRLPKR